MEFENDYRLNTKLITVVFAGRKRICVNIPYNRVFCDTIEIELLRFPDCRGRLVGSYQSCSVGSRTSFFFRMSIHVANVPVERKRSGLMRCQVSP